MTSQRDLLAAALHETWTDRGRDPTYGEWADALLARGVLVVTAESLAAALRKQRQAFVEQPESFELTSQVAAFLLAALREGEGQ